MASTTIAPPASAPAAAPTAAPAPASAPASTAAPSTPAAQPTTPAAQPSTPLSMGDRLSQGWEKAKASVPVSDDKPEAAAQPEAGAQPAATPADGTKPEGEAAAQPEAGAQAEGDGKPKEGAQPEEAEFTIDDIDTLAPQDFARELATDPQVKAFFDSKPELKNKVFAALRRDTENREIRQYAPTVEIAKQMHGAASTFQRFDNSFLKATTPENAQEFLNHWVREAMYVDDKGQPIVKDGKYELHPALGYIFNHITKNQIATWPSIVEKTGQMPQELGPVFDGLQKFAVAKGDERLQTALGVIREAITPSSPASGELPDELKPYADSLKAREDKLTERERNAERQQREQSATANQVAIDRVMDSAAGVIRNQLEPRFAAAGLTDFEKKAALREIGEAIDTALKNDEFYQGEADRLEAEEPSPERDRALRKLYLTHTQTKIGKIVTDTLLRAKQGALSRQTAKETTVANQTATSRTEPQGTSITTSAPQTATPAALRAQVIAEYKAQNNGESPDLDYIVKTMAAKLNLFKKAS